MVVVLPAVEHFRRLRSPFLAGAAGRYAAADLAAALGLLRRLAPSADVAELVDEAAEHSEERQEVSGPLAASRPPALTAPVSAG